MTFLPISRTDHPLLWFGNTAVSIVVPSDSGADRLCCIEHWLPYGDSPPRHVHLGEDEMFFLVEGRLRLELGGQTLWLQAGQTALAPKGIPHTYRVESAEGAHVFTVTSGADFESLVTSAARPAVLADLPPAAAPTPETIAALSALCARNRIEVVGPPLA